ncbi:OmpA family protein [Pseudomaricurvus alkylphenolicus]|jgi:outer membrane protein OmpA-like peptidoglycan-associated protein|uniref:OmpA family protein n=1 Tax=Pseudomaricurvus alkylphenolicus TaxID=1306991 RepID=UPI0014201B31|nr:OmpA family protein [Pseudomaricurvus alkylphenolicus]NIB41682.1 OmpA family protein [Pseudomaricurvus alkylphenolicus]
MNKRFTGILTGLCLLGALPGCTTFDPYTGEEKTTNTAIGAGVGAGVAAVLAYLDNRDDDSRKRNQRILAAAAGGAAIGGGIGYYMDVQEAKLRKQLRGSGVSVERVGDNINLIMPGNITFATDSSNIASDFFPILDSVALVLKEYNRTLVVVGGHTDSDGAASYNQTLSEGRASSVTGYLSSQGILKDRLETVGFGESQPVASNSTAEGKQLNRRVEITLVPVESTT